MTLPFPFRPNMRPAAVITYTDQTQNSSAQVTYTFSTRAIGSAAVNRYVICSVETSGTGAAISSVTIGGVGATQIVNALNSSGRVSIWIAAVPTGTTATVVVVFAGGGENRCGIGLWAPTASTQRHLILNHQQQIQALYRLRYPTTGLSLESLLEFPPRLHGRFCRRTLTPR